MSDTTSKYRIRVGNIDVSAPTKSECLALFRAVAKQKLCYPIDAAIV